MTSVNGSEEASEGSFQTYDDRVQSFETPKHTPSNITFKDQLAWYKMPELSISELAFRLKQAELRVFGKDKFLLNNNNKVFDNSKNINYNDEINTEDDISINSDFLHKNIYSDVYNAFDTSAQKTLMAISEKYKKLEDRCPDNDLFDNDLNFHSDVSLIKEEPMDQLSNELSKTYKKFGCGWCPYRTDSKAHLMRHSKSMHKDLEMKIVLDPAYIPPPKTPKDLKRKHQCDMCSYQTDCKSHLRRHQGSVHCKDKLYECPICKIEFARSEQAKVHHMANHPEKHFDIRNMHKPLPYVKKYKLSTEERMEKIKSLFDDVDQYTIKQSPSKTNINDLSNESEVNESNEKFNANFSLRSKRKSRVRDNNAFGCLKCDFSCRDMWHLKRHVIDVHSMQKNFNCKVCHYTTSRAHRLYCHMLKHGELFCHICKFSTINPEIYKLHSQACIIAQKSLQCVLCSIDFINMSTYYDHIISHHAENMKECSKCSFITTSDQDMNSHTLSHNWETRVCKLCWFMANDADALIEHFCDFHAKFDDRTKEWICSECDEKANDKYNLANHVEMHVCSVLSCPMETCQFKCSLQSSLDVHLKYIHRDNSDDNLNEEPGFEDENCSTNNENNEKNLSLHDSEDGNVDCKSNDDSLIQLSNKKVSDSEDNSFTEIKTPQEEINNSSQNNSKEQFLGYVCPHCPERAPFKYKKSFDKHTLQHALMIPNGEVAVDESKDLSE